MVEPSNAIADALLPFAVPLISIDGENDSLTLVAQVRGFAEDEVLAALTVERTSYGGSVLRSKQSREFRLSAKPETIAVLGLGGEELNFLMAELVVTHQQTIIGRAVVVLGVEK